MNILPKKSWHVRTKENIARVRRDEAKAAEEEKERLRKIELAEKEARTNLLRDRARSVYDGRENLEEQEPPQKHVNFFEDLEKGDDQVVKPNEEYEKEKKEEKEKYEKQIGYLTYLGQDTNEATGNVSWYNKYPDRLKSFKDDPEVLSEKKIRHDPLYKMNMFLGKKYDDCNKHESLSSKRKMKHKKDTKKKKNRSSLSSFSDKEPEKSSNININELRAKRLRREAEEKLRSAALLAKMRGDLTPILNQPQKEPIIKQKYNSQFNPQIAKQNSYV